MTEKYRGALVRSRTRRFLQEPPTRRAFGDEKQSALEKVLDEIEYGGQSYSDSRSILGEFWTYYEKLFNGNTGTCSTPDFNVFLQPLPKLSDDERALAE